MDNVLLAHVLGVISTYDESGNHFTKIWDHDILHELEKQELILINRPRHHTGVPYGMDEWWVELTQKGEQLFEEHMHLLDYTK